MHRFERGPAPIDFSKHLGKNWDAFSVTEDHRTLGDALYRRQNGYCAYCETSLPSRAQGHIEHLERRSDSPEKTFVWDNLFFSCLRQTSCGKYKDDRRICFNRADIVDPSQENPADFFAFSMTGKILARDGLGKHSAEETIRVFNLNDPGLVQKRKGAAITVSQYLNKTDSMKDDLMQGLIASHASFLLVYSTLLKRN